MIVSALAVAAFYQSVIATRLRRWIFMKFTPDNDRHRIVIRHISRNEERERRARRRFGLLTFIAGSVATAIITVAATYGGEILARLTER